MQDPFLFNRKLRFLLNKTLRGMRTRAKWKLKRPRSAREFRKRNSLFFNRKLRSLLNKMLRRIALRQRKLLPPARSPLRPPRDRRRRRQVPCRSVLPQPVRARGPVRAAKETARDKGLRRPSQEIWRISRLRMASSTMPPIFS